MTKEAALTMALENLLQATRHLNVCPATVEAAEKALAQPSDSVEQESVYLIWPDDMEGWTEGDKKQYDLMPEEERWLLYTTPPKRKPLTDEGIQEICWNLYEHVFFPGDGQRNLRVARAIEAAHGIKETA